jgi:alkanesulfonate monooxygenase SsuD/methylene tetrahydromethanopterin reductase-like flavin-dependent oxidoreductase (luciferase family)
MAHPSPRQSTRIGLLSLVDHFADPVTGKQSTTRERFLEVIEQGVLAEAMGFERFAVGEHHFSKYNLPCAHLLLAALATKTHSIRLFTAVTLLPLHDPVQLAEQIGVLDQLSNGRMEVSCARGVSELTGAVFGVASERVYEVMEQHLVQFLDLLSSGRVQLNSAADHVTKILEENIPLVPRAIQQPHPRVWLGSGVHEESCDLAVRLGMPLILPSLFRHPEDYLPCIERYRCGLAERGMHERQVTALPSYCWVAKTSQEARREWQPRLEQYIAYAKNYRGGFGRNLDFESITSTRGPGICGSPAEIVDKLGRINELLGLSHHLLLVDIGGMPFDNVRQSVELLGTEVLSQL